MWLNGGYKPEEKTHHDRAHRTFASNTRIGVDDNTWDRNSKEATKPQRLAGARK